MASTSSTNSGSSITTSDAAAKPRVWSLAGAYNAGPLSLSLGYELHQDFYNNRTTALPTAAAQFSRVTRSGWHISGAHLGNGLKLGLTYRRKLTLAWARKAYQLGAEWKISGRTRCASATPWLMTPRPRRVAPSRWSSGRSGSVLQRRQA
jgi:hypothetical protein